MAYWVVTERYENWLIDKQMGFTVFGVSESKRKLASRIVAGDSIITYISSGRSCFSDLREATVNGVTELGIKGRYDDPFPFAIRTKPVLILQEEKWISIKDIARDLSFLKNGYWIQAFRASPKQIPEQDGIYLIDLFTKRNCND